MRTYTSQPFLVLTHKAPPPPFCMQKIILQIYGGDCYLNLVVYISSSSNLLPPTSPPVPVGNMSKGYCPWIEVVRERERECVLILLWWRKREKICMCVCMFVPVCSFLVFCICVYSAVWCLAAICIRMFVCVCVRHCACVCLRESVFIFSFGYSFILTYKSQCHGNTLEEWIPRKGAL